MKTIRVTNTIRLIATLAAAGLACGAYAGPRAPIATPYGAVVSDYEPGTGNWHAPRGGVLDLQAAADFIVAQQCANGGWGWPVAPSRPACARARAGKARARRTADVSRMLMLVP